MLSGDRENFPYIAGGVLRQGGTSNVRGATATRQTVGIWTLILQTPLVADNFIFLTGMMSGYSPGVEVGIDNASDTEKTISLYDSATGEHVDVGVSFVFLDIQPLVPSS